MVETGVAVDREPTGFGKAEMSKQDRRMFSYVGAIKSYKGRPGMTQCQEKSHSGLILWITTETNSVTHI